MDVIYKITYKPHLNTSYPKYYIGSKKNWTEKSKYMGSPTSISVFDYTEGLPLYRWWKNKTSQNREDFIFELIESYDHMTSLELVERESEIHQSLNVLGEEYFNQTIATKGYVSQKNTDETKRKKSEKTKAYWDSEEGQKKKERLVERNKQYKSEEMKDRWSNNREFMLEHKNQKGRPAGAQDLKPRKRRPIRKVQIRGIIYETPYEAAKVFKIDPTNIRRRCRLPQYTDWNYV